MYLIYTPFTLLPYCLMKYKKTPKKQQKTSKEIPPPSLRVTLSPTAKKDFG